MVELESLPRDEPDLEVLGRLADGPGSPTLGLELELELELEVEVEVELELELELELDDGGIGTGSETEGPVGVVALGQPVSTMSVELSASAPSILFRFR